ncbi:hypothetical protein DOZ91_06495 [Peribacillus frigoritolerans]|nr:hypothetical protein DOZ91_06495 [Peribacillus frigoritolerans]
MSTSRTDFGSYHRPQTKRFSKGEREYYKSQLDIANQDWIVRGYKAEKEMAAITESSLKDKYTESVDRMIKQL